MQLSEQCCNLEQAKRLNELGIKQGLSIFFYDEYREGLVYNNSPTGGYFNAESCFSAFTVAELGMMLPDMLNTHLQYELCCIKEDDCWLVRYVRANDIKDCLFGKADLTEAEARAAMLIYLLENNLITPEQVNTPLKGE